MKLEIRKLQPIRAANIAALVQALVMACFVLIAAPFVLLAIALGGLKEAPELAFVLPIMLLAYPILGLIFGWIGGLLAAAIYNLVVRLTGGLIIEAHDLEPVSSPTQIPAV